MNTTKLTNELIFRTKKTAHNFSKTVHNMCVHECINCAIFSTNTSQLVFKLNGKCITWYYPQISPLFFSRLIHMVKPKIIPVEHIFYPQSTPLIIKPINL